MKAKELISKLKLNANEFVLIENTKCKILFDSRKPVYSEDLVFDREVKEFSIGILGDSIHVIVE